MVSEINPDALGSNDVCYCDYDWSDEELYGLIDDDFDREPCARCHARVVSVPPSLWAVEEEDDC